MYNLPLNGTGAPMSHTQHLSSTLRRFASGVLWLSVLLVVFSPGIVFLNGFVPDTANHLLRLLDMDGFRFTAAHSSGMLRMFVWGLVAISCTAAVLTLSVLIRLLHQFEGGTAFSLESIRLVRILGWIQIAKVPVWFLMLGSFSMVSKQVAGLVVQPWKQVGPASLDGLFWGGLTLLIAYVLEEGFRLEAEQGLVI
jgi:Protein of unknown function (DUF2975)